MVREVWGSRPRPRVDCSSAGVRRQSQHHCCANCCSSAGKASSSCRSRWLASPRYEALAHACSTLFPLAYTRCSRWLLTPTRYPHLLIYSLFPPAHTRCSRWLLTPTRYPHLLSAGKVADKNTCRVSYHKRRANLFGALEHKWQQFLDEKCEEVSPTASITCACTALAAHPTCPAPHHPAPPAPRYSHRPLLLLPRHRLLTAQRPDLPTSQRWPT